MTHPFTQGEDYEKPKNCKFLETQEALETQTYGNNTEYTLGEIDGHNKSKELLDSDKWVANELSDTICHQQSSKNRPDPFLHLLKGRWIRNFSVTKTTAEQPFPVNMQESLAELPNSMRDPGVLGAMN